MSNVTISLKDLGWEERFAIFDALNTTDEQICAVLQIDATELSVVRSLRADGKFIPSLPEDIDPQDYIDEIESAEIAPATTTVEVVVGEPATATKPKREPKKRGRKGDKIQRAFAAITITPVDLEQFAEAHEVSVHVLRQSKRFDKTGIAGAVHVKKIDGVVSIFREVVED